MTEPEKGSFYYHHKHDPAMGINHHAYEIIGIGHNTEIDDLGESAMVVYAPLYDTAEFYIVGKHYALRPLKMFMDKNFEKPASTQGGNGKIIPERFIKITDEKVISET